jgi:hypothetical protein
MNTYRYVSTFSIELASLVGSDDEDETDLNKEREYVTYRKVPNKASSKGNII